MKAGRGGRRRPLRVLVAVAGLVALATPWQSPADAQIPTPVGELPVPTTLPRIMGGGDVTPPVSSPPTTVPPISPPAAPTTEGSRTVATPSEAEPATRTPSGSSRRGSSTRAGTDAGPAGDTTLVDRAVADAPARPAIARLRRVTVPAARQFGFPLVLGAFVLAFLVVQGRLDARDPKLAAAPVTVDDDLLPFL